MINNILTLHEKAIELGSKGILVASGIVKAKNWNKIIEEFVKAML